MPAVLVAMAGRIIRTVERTWHDIVTLRVLLKEFYQFFFNDFDEEDLQKKKITMTCISRLMLKF